MLELGTEHLGNLGKFCVHKLADFVIYDNKDSPSFDAVKHHLVEITYSTRSTRRLTNLVILYDGHHDMPEVTKFLMRQVGQHCAVWCAGQIHDTKNPPELFTGVHIVKFDNRQLPQEWTFKDIQPKFFKFAISKTSVDVVEKVQSVFRKAYTNAKIVDPTKDGQKHSFEEVLGIVEKLSDEQWIALRANAALAPDKNKTSFQWAVLKTYQSVREALNARRASNSNIVFSPYTPPPEYKIPELCHLRGLQQRGQALDAVSGTWKEHTVESLFTTPLSLKYAIVIGSSDQNTGIGKTSLALRLCSELSKAIVEASGLPHSHAKVVVVSTIDILRNQQLQRGCVLLFDEFHVSDRDQIQYLSEHGLKGLLCPAMQGTLRARNTDVVIPAGIPRVFTTNSRSGLEWCGARFKWSAPLQRRAVFFLTSLRHC